MCAGAAVVTLVVVVVVKMGHRARRRRTGAVGGGARGGGRDSEFCVVACEEVEWSVVARALAIAKFLVVAAGLVEVLALEGEGEVVEELAELGGGLVAEFVR